MARAAKPAPEGVEIRHQKGCASHAGRRCDCFPNTRAHVYDSVAKRLVRKSFNEPRHRSLSLRERVLEGASKASQLVHDPGAVAHAEACRHIIDDEKARAFRHRLRD